MSEVRRDGFKNRSNRLSSLGPRRTLSTPRLLPVAEVSRSLFLDKNSMGRIGDRQIRSEKYDEVCSGWSRTYDPSPIT